MWAFWRKNLFSHKKSITLINKAIVTVKMSDFIKNGYWLGSNRVAEIDRYESNPQLLSELTFKLYNEIMYTY
jgi:hypothetical protein